MVLKDDWMDEDRSEGGASDTFRLIRKEFLNLVERAFSIQIDVLVAMPEISKDNKDALILSKELFQRMRVLEMDFQGTTNGEMREEIQKAMFEEIVREVHSEETPELRAALKKSFTLPGGVFLKTLEIVFEK